jgi:hypothetical protein
MSNDLNELLENKTFAQLTAVERTYVLTQISAQEYDWQREILLSSKIAFEEAPVLTPLPPTAALMALRENKKSSPPFLFVHKIPTWMAIAACLLVFLLAKGSGFMETEKQPALCAEIIDTVYVEKMVRAIVQENNTTRKDTLIAVNSTSESHPKIPVKNPSEPKRTEPAFTAEMLSIGNINYDAYFSNYSSSSGTSLQNDSITQLVNNTMF